MKLPLFVGLLALSGGLASPPAEAAADFYVGVAGGFTPTLDVLFYDGRAGLLEPILVPRVPVESIDGLTVRADGVAFGTVNVLGIGSVVRLDGTELVAHDRNGGLWNPLGLDFGPDGRLAVGGFVMPAPGSDTPPVAVVKRFDGATGAFVDDFIAPGTAGMSFPHTVIFRGDSLVIADAGAGVVRFDARTGAFRDVLVPGGAGRIAFGPDGDLFMSGGPGVLRFDGDTGAPRGTFVDGAASGLRSPQGLDFGADGDLYVVDADAERVLRFDGQTGAFAGVVVELSPADDVHPTFLVAVPPVPEPAAWQSMPAALCGLVLWTAAARRRRAPPEAGVASPPERRPA